MAVRKEEELEAKTKEGPCILPLHEVYKLFLLHRIWYTCKKSSK